MTDSSGTPPTADVRTLSLSFDLNRLPGVATAVGVALVSAAIVVSAMYARQGDELDTSILVMGLIAAAGLLVVAAGAHLMLPDAERRATLVSWPGAAGIVGAGIMFAVAIDDDPVATYAAGALILGVSVLSYLATKAAPFVLTTILGLFLLYAQVFADVFDNDDDATSFIIDGAAILVFVGAVTGLGWLLPKTRVLSAVVVGIGAIAMLGVTFSAMIAFGQFQAYVDSSEGVRYSGTYEQLQGEHMDEPYSSESDEGYSLESEYPDDAFFAENPYRDDIWVMLSYAAALALFWALCALATGHVAFRILSATILVFAIPASIFALAVSHPTWWQVGLTALGGLVLAGVGYRTMKTEPLSDA